MLLTILNNRQHKIRGGEEILDIFDYVEDTKGNPNERGRLLVTNLRLIWYSLNNNKFNLCTYYFEPKTKPMPKTFSTRHNKLKTPLTLQQLVSTVS